MLILCYPKCSTCKKALAWLKANNLSVTYRDISEEKTDRWELTEWIKLSGLPTKKFFNTSGKKYRELNLKNVIDSMTSEEMIELLSEDGMLVKRPLLVGNDFVFAGFNEKTWASRLLG